jgi:hypothetical protein
MRGDVIGMDLEDRELAVRRGGEVFRLKMRRRSCFAERCAAFSFGEANVMVM